MMDAKISYCLVCDSRHAPGIKHEQKIIRGRCISLTYWELVVMEKGPDAAGIVTPELGRANGSVLRALERDRLVKADRVIGKKRWFITDFGREVHEELRGDPAWFAELRRAAI